MIKISVIIPIYKVEAFIKRCATTLLEQTFQEVEYIFVDDATPDGSIEILKEVISCYPHRLNQVHIVHHEVNKGLPAARNTGLSLATGEYIYHCDSDDYVEPTMLEDMYHVAKKEEADIVWCDWFLTFAEKERYMKQPHFKTPMKALKSMLSGGMKYNVWNKLVRHALYKDNHITFPAGCGMGEDMTMILLFVHANTVAYLSKAYYHYVKTNTNAFCQNYSEKHLQELKNNVRRVVNYIHDVHGDTLEKELIFFKLDVKLPFLITKQFKRWEELYPEANEYILQNKSLSNRTRWIQWLAAKKQYWLVVLYSYVINKIIYGILYK